MQRSKRAVYREELARLTGCRGGLIFREVQRLTSFTEDITLSGKIPGAKTLRIRVLRHGPIARLLGQRSILELRRLRYADRDAVCIELTFLPGRYRGILGKADLRGSLYQFLKGTGEKLASSRELMEVRNPSPEEQTLLGIRKEVPVIQIARLAFDRSGTPLEFTRNVLRADRYLFYFELRSR